jgi:2Fe-2S ferredoxin
MPQITYRHPDGSTETLDDVTAGTSVMRAAVSRGVRGIIGECGGQVICATCHVYVDEEFIGDLPPIGDEEDEMLDTTASPRDPVRSRLGCQITLGPQLERVCVEVPAEQETW